MRNNDRKELSEEFFSIYETFVKQWRSEFFEIFSKHNISKTQIETLALIHKNQPINVKDLSQKLDISPSAISQIIEPLEEAGYIKKQEDNDDRRIKWLKISKKGKARFKEFKKIRYEFFVKKTACLDKDDLNSLIEIYKKLIN